ncbi:MAG: sigma 54-interacting transcriptional regulator [Bacteroidia bacterium]
MTKTPFASIRTLGELKKSGYTALGIKDEMRKNLICNMKEKKNLFDEIKGYEDSVIPQMQTAILSRHNIIFLGLRGQAKTRLARLMTRLLDEYIPVVEGSEINDDPFNPLSRFAKDLIAEKGDQTPVNWIHRDERYTEKLATPDVSVSDLIGDLDPIKAATQKLTYADERVIHYGLIPRSNRGIFVINELPDLQPRIQVALFNILQEGDIQVRGFKLRLPLDIQFVFTANPEDYTNRGSIVTPLKDRIDSQILTHYPKSIFVSKTITGNEALLTKEQKENVHTTDLIKNLVEQVAFEARQSEFIDQKSGVSARLTISAYENLHSTAERRILLNNEKNTTIRISDLFGILPSITGKVELVYEGEMEGVANVAQNLIGKAIRSQFIILYPDPEKIKRRKGENPYAEIISWFSEGNKVDLMLSSNDKEYEKELNKVPGLNDVVTRFHKSLDKKELLLHMEFVLHGLSEFSQLSKHRLETGLQFKDLVGSMFNFTADESEDEDEEFL